MKPFISLFSPSLLLLLLLIASSHVHGTSRHDIVRETCEKCSSTSPNVNSALCIASFDSDPKSHCSDLKRLAMIATRIAVANATDIRSELRKILKKQPKGSNLMKSCLEDCFELYSDSVSTLKDSVKAIKAGQYDDANVWISSAVDTPSTCENGFGEGGLESPLTKENDEFFAHTVIALCITAMLQGPSH